MLTVNKTIVIIFIIITSLSPHNAGNVNEYPVTPCGVGYSVPSFRPFNCPALFTESFLTSSASSYDDDDNDDDDDDNDGDNEEKNSEGVGGGGRVKIEQKLEYAPVVWWTSLARVFLGCLLNCLWQP